MADEDGINLANMIISIGLFGILAVLAIALTIWLFIRWRGAVKEAKTFYSVVVEMAPSVAFADLTGDITTYESISTLGVDENRGQIKDRRLPSMYVTASLSDFMKLRLGHEIAYGGPPSSKIHYEDAPLRYAEVQKVIGQDQALVDSTGEEGMRVRRLTQEVSQDI